MSLIPSSLVEKSWRQALSRLETGRLQFIAPNGEVTVAGGKEPGPEASFHIRDWDVLRRIMARGDIGLGEEFIAGSWETDDVEALVSLFLLNLDQLENFSHGNFLNRLGFVIHNALVRRNSIAGSARNIKAHYDVGNDFYSLWLDKSMTYSSALYKDAKALYEAQQNKYDRILSKFDKPRANVLEIGCGWGGFAERAADAAASCHRPDHFSVAAQIRHRPPAAAAPTSGWRIIANPRAPSTISSRSKCSKRWASIIGRNISPPSPSG